jgi:hypothetical protein
MRFLKVLLTAIVTAIALTAGLLAAAVAAIVGIGFYLSTRLLRRKQPSTSSPRRPAKAAHSERDGVIEITATEVAPDAASLTNSTRDAS